MIRRLVLLGLIIALPLAAEVLVESFELRLSKAVALVQSNTANAVEELETLLRERPNDAKALYHMGMALASLGHQLDPGAMRQETLRRSRAIIVRAQQAGLNDPIIATVLKEINPDGTENGRRYSVNKDADRLFQQAEAAFQKRDFPAAQKLYQAVLNLEPDNYMAIMGVGDSFFSSGRYQDAEAWFEKASVLEPNKELAHRYCGDALLRLGRKNDALEKYLSAVIAEPYNGYARRALETGCQALLLKPWVVAQRVPFAEVKEGAKGPEIALPEKSTVLHMAYALARAQWQTENKAKHLAGGGGPRQTLDEEISALTKLVQIYAELKQSKEPAPPDLAQALADADASMTELSELEKAGLLPAHILLFRANQDIALDYPAYRDPNRAKLREYLIKYYLHIP